MNFLHSSYLSLCTSSYYYPPHLEYEYGDQSIAYIGAEMLNFTDSSSTPSEPSF
jgi:hypothetical protein